MTSSNGNIFRVTGHLCGEFTGTGEFPTQILVTRSLDFVFDLNKRLSKQWWVWWFETPSCPLWRHCNVKLMSHCYDFKANRNGFESYNSRLLRRGAFKFVLFRQNSLLHHRDRQKSWRGHDSFKGFIIVVVPQRIATVWRYARWIIVDCFWLFIVGSTNPYWLTWHHHSHLTWVYRLIVVQEFDTSWQLRRDLMSHKGKYWRKLLKNHFWNTNQHYMMSHVIPCVSWIKILKIMYRKTFNVSRILVGNKQRVLMHGHQGWNVRHGLCHIYMIYVYIWVVYSFCLFCCLFIIVTTQFVALYKPCKPKPKPSTYDPPGQPPPGRDPKTDT